MKANQVRVIESSANLQFKTWKKCLESSGIDKHGKFLLSGEKLVAELLDARPSLVEAVIYSARHERLDLPKDIPEYSLPQKLFAELDELGTGSPLLVVKSPDFKEWDPASEAKGLEVILALQDPGNLGAAIRLCEGFSVSKVICLQECAHPLHPKAVKAAAGSVLRVNMEYGPSITKLKPSPELVALDANGTSVTKFSWAKNVRLVLGEEGRGVPEEIKKQAKVISIPIKKSLESLNATSALAIALYAHSQK